MRYPARTFSENESTEQIKGIAPVPFWVRPERRRPRRDHRSPHIADDPIIPIPAELQEIEATDADWEEHIQERYGEDLEETELSMRAGGIDSALRRALRLIHSLRMA